MEKTKKSTIVISFLAFIVIWTLRTVLLKPWIDANLGIWERQIVNGIIKLIIWCGLAVFLLRRNPVQFSIKDMFCKNFSWRLLGIASVVSVLFHVVVMLIQSGKINILPFHPSQLISQFLVVGITEELLFRGWFYNALRSTMTPMKANAISSAMFVTSHWPSYIVSGVGIGSIIYLSIVIFLMGLVFGYLFEKSKNILVPTAVHSIWDLLQLVTVGL